MANSATILMKMTEFCSMSVFVYSALYELTLTQLHTYLKNSTDMTEVKKYLTICTYLYYLGEHFVTKAGSYPLDIP